MTFPASLIPRGKPRLFIIFIATFDISVTLVLLFVFCAMLQMYSLANFIYPIAIGSAQLCFVSGLTYCIRKMSGYYRHIEPKPWRERFGEWELKREVPNC
jgi:hypothetical protein